MKRLAFTILCAALFVGVFSVSASSGCSVASGALVLHGPYCVAEQIAAPDAEILSDEMTLPEPIKLVMSMIAALSVAIILRAETANSVFSFWTRRIAPGLRLSPPIFSRLD